MKKLFLVLTACALSLAAKDKIPYVNGAVDESRIAKSGINS